MHVMSSDLNMAHHIIWQIYQSRVCVVSDDAQCCFIRPYMLIVQICGTFQINTLHIYRYALEHSVVLHL